MTQSAAPRTRFAPSPTGYLHIGGARTALFNYLLARRHGGAFVLRIEDTDRERSTQQAIDAILDGLGWLGIAWDEGPFFQMQRLDHYAAAADRLLAAGDAYRCYCTPEELDAKRKAAQAAGRSPGYDGTCRDRAAAPADRPHTVRLRAPRDGETVIDDLVKGRVVIQHAELDDLVLVRSDGVPTYNFSVVVDDAEMAITHVIRGDDHLTNTPKQVLLYRALGHTPPAFAHVPMILGTDRTRLSKRHGATSVTAYRDMGYLPDAVVNYLVRLGWSHGDQEIFSRTELIAKFDLEHVGTSAGVFDPDKMLWLNAHYLKALAPEDLVAATRPFIAAAELPVPGDDAWLARTLASLQERAKTLVELVDQARYYLLDEIAVDPGAAAKHLKTEIRPALADLRDALAGLAAWTVDELTATFEAVIARHGLKLGKLAQPVRVAVTGGTASPGIFDVLEILGRERTLARLDRTLASIA